MFSFIICYVRCSYFLFAISDRAELCMSAVNALLWFCMLPLCGCCSLHPSICPSHTGYKQKTKWHKNWTQVRGSEGAHGASCYIWTSFQRFWGVAKGCYINVLNNNNNNNDNVFNRLHETKSRLCRWTLFINTHSTVSWTQSIRQILLLTLDVPMLKKCASCPVQE